jgi:hypothetical protein
MKLFEDKQRTRMEPKRPGEDDYSFYDSCALPGYDDYRARLNGWLEEMPESAQKDLLPRFRKNEIELLPVVTFAARFWAGVLGATVLAANKHTLAKRIANCVGPRPATTTRLAVWQDLASLKS